MPWWTTCGGCHDYHGGVGRDRVSEVDNEGLVAARCEAPALSPAASLPNKLAKLEGELIFPYSVQ